MSKTKEVETINYVLDNKELLNAIETISYLYKDTDNGLFYDHLVKLLEIQENRANISIINDK